MASSSSPSPSPARRRRGRVCRGLRPGLILRPRRRSDCDTRRARRIAAARPCTRTPARHDPRPGRPGSPSIIDGRAPVHTRRRVEQGARHSGPPRRPRDTKQFEDPHPVPGELRERRERARRSKSARGPRPTQPIAGHRPSRPARGGVQVDRAHAAAPVVVDRGVRPVRSRRRHHWHQHHRPPRGRRTARGSRARRPATRGGSPCRHCAASRCRGANDAAVVRRRGTGTLAAARTVDLGQGGRSRREGKREWPASGSRRDAHG